MNEYEEDLNKILKLSPKALMEVWKCKRDVIHKYKKFKSTPPLDKLIFLEDNYDINIRSWHFLKEAKNV
jgi:hypothetical protein